MTDINDFLKSEKEAYKRDPEKYERERRADARQMYKDVDRYENEKLMERAERMAKSKEARSSGSSGGGGDNSSGGGIVEASAMQMAFLEILRESTKSKRQINQISMSPEHEALPPSIDD